MLASPTPVETRGGPTPSPAVSTPAPSASPTASLPVNVRNFTITTRDGQRWELESEEGEWLDGKSRAHLTNVVWYLRDENDERTVQVVSPEADAQMDKKIVTFIGETVVTRLGLGETLLVNHLIYKSEERMFYGSQGVVYRRPKGELFGETLTATAELDKVQLKGRVQGKTVGGLSDLGLTSKTDREQRTR